MAKREIAIITGGRSSERDISLVTAERVQENLDAAKYNAALVDSSDSKALLGLAENPPDMAFIAQHGRGGEDGAVQGFLETLNIAYTGSPILASALAMDKVRCKEFLAARGIAMPRHVSMQKYFGRAYADELALPVIIKPNSAGSSDGLSVVRDSHDIQKGIDTAFAFDDAILIEEFIAGMEITAAVLGNAEMEALPLIEIVPAKGIYDREAKYTPGATDEICPARLSDCVTTHAQQIAMQCHVALGCRGMSRTDMMVTTNGEIYVIEVNTIPGMTQTSLLPRAALQAGYSFPQLLDRIIDLALEGRR